MTSLNLDAIHRRADHYAATRAVAVGEIGAYGWAAAAINSAEDVPALLAEVERLQTKLEDYRVRLVASEADLLDVRGILSPNGEPERTPVPLVPTVAPAVQWLADEVGRLRAIAAEPTEET